jgi:hypothetical protein
VVEHSTHHPKAVGSSTADTTKEKIVNTKGGSTTVRLTSCLTDLESAV